MDSSKLRRTLVAALLSGAAVFPAHALVLTATDTPLYVDASSATSTISFPTSGLISKVIVTLDFMKCETEFTTISGACPGIENGFSYPEEIVFRLTSAEGTVISLVEVDTYVGSLDDLIPDPFDPGNIRVVVSFDDSASTRGGGASLPASGTFKGVQALSLLNGENALGDWPLSFEDQALVDPLVLHSFTLDVSLRVPTGQAPLPGTLPLLGLGLAGLGAIARRR